MKRLNAKGESEAKARSPKQRKLRALTIPTSRQINEVVADFRLAKGPAAVLDFVIKDVLADLRSYQSWRARKVRQDERLADPIEEIHKPLTKLVSYLETNPGALKEILTASAGEKLGELFSFTGIGKALDMEAFPDDGKMLRGSLRRSAQQFDIASAERFYARTREDLGLVQGDRLFLYALRVVLEPLEGWIATKAANQGGRPANIERRYMIQRLAEAAPHILGSEPPISIGSPFVALCGRVLPLCGFAEDGIDKAVTSVLSALKSKARQSTGAKRSTK